MKVKSIVYLDANGNEFPVTVNKHRVSSVEELLIGLDLKEIDGNDTVSVRIINNSADIGKGDPITDVDDITAIDRDTTGNVVLSGFGG